MKKLNFGCGTKIKNGWTNVDLQKAKGIDKSFDFNKYPYPLKDNTFDYIFLDMVLEHLPNPQNVLKELWRIGKPNATIKIIVPYYNSYIAHGDHTHVNFFNEWSLQQALGQSGYLHEKQKEQFEILKMKAVPQRFLRFMPKPMLNILKKLLGNVVVILDAEVKVLK
ncbi:methyltransferase domain-containing protein [archaeon]|nr:methyltransferase domain-containing protein [archaeon]